MAPRGYGPQAASDREVLRRGSAGTGHGVWKICGDLGAALKIPEHPMVISVIYITDRSEVLNGLRGDLDSIEAMRRVGLRGTARLVGPRGDRRAVDAPLRTVTDA
jgi:hypothetical protein